MICNEKYKRWELVSVCTSYLRVISIEGSRFIHEQSASIYIIYIMYDRLDARINYMM